MIELDQSARDYLQRLLAQQGIPGLGVRMRAIDAGTPNGDCRLEYCEPDEVRADDLEIRCEGFSIYVDPAGVRGVAKSTEPCARAWSAACSSKYPGSARFVTSPTMPAANGRTTATVSAPDPGHWIEPSSAHQTPSRSVLAGARTRRAPDSAAHGPPRRPATLSA
jgi:Fe-S cluster assembly iron-binding protein IscA